jgi:hypothetical protein
MGPSFVGSVRRHVQLEVHEVHSSVVPAGLQLAGRSDPIVGGGEQLLLPPRMPYTLGPQQGHRVGDSGNLCHPRLPGSLVINSSADRDRQGRDASGRIGLCPRTIRPRGALEATGDKPQSALCRSSGISSEPNMSSCLHVVPVRIIDQKEDAFLCVLTDGCGVKWLHQDVLFDGTVCRFPEIWSEFIEFNLSLEATGIITAVPTRQSKRGIKAFEVSDKELSGHVGWLASKARSPETVKSYAKLWNTVVLPHCRWRVIDPWAITGLEVANLLAWHEMTGKAGEVERLFNAIRVSTLARMNRTIDNLELAREVVKGCARIHAEEKCDVIRVGFPVFRFKELCDMREAYFNFRTGVRDRLVIGLGIRAMRRPSELAKFRRKHFRWASPSIENWDAPALSPPGFEQLWLEVFVRDQKNDKEARGQWIFIEPTWNAQCTCTLMREFCEFFSITIGDSVDGMLPLFMNLNDDSKGITTGAINSLVKKAAGMLKLEHVTGQSLRIGGATSAAGAGLGLEIIRSIGGWFGDSVFRYIRAAAAPALSVSSKMGF